MSQYTDETEYSTLVASAADGLYAGYLSWEDIELPEDVDVDWAAFEADVEDKVATIADRRENGTDEGDESDGTAVDELDWQALWAEFGFDTRDAAGCAYASKTQLVAAIQSTAQGYSGDAIATITSAVEDGPLHRVETATEDGATTLRGYVLGDVS